jgi:uncharacterized protein (TIGR02145 family)
MTIGAVFLACLPFFAQPAGTVTDMDGNTYQTVKIGNQIWMAENLRVTRYRNGDPIAVVPAAAQWVGMTGGAYCNYDNGESNVAAYGRLYNWHAVNDTRRIAPAGWHVPTDGEWKQLETFLGMSRTQADATGWRGTREGDKLKETGAAHWRGPNAGAINESGFSARPGGFRAYDDGRFYRKGDSTDLWSATECGSASAWCRSLGFRTAGVGRSDGSKQEGFSVRCVKD